MEKKNVDRKAYFRDYYHKNQPKMVENARTRNRNFRKENPTKASIYSTKYREKCRYEAIKYYSNGAMHCACCGETHYEFLAIDHINGGGNQMRKLRGHGNLAQWLKSRGFPLGYRILCHNCNSAIGSYGYCPHQKEEQNG